MSASQNQDGGERRSSEEAEEMPPGQVQPGTEWRGPRRLQGRRLRKGLGTGLSIADHRQEATRVTET